MAFDKKNWLNRECEYPDRRLLYPTDGGASRSYTVERDEGVVYEEGDRFDAPTMNDLETRIEQADEACAEALSAHAEDKENPHGVSKAQVGLGNVSNALQATKTEFNTHATSTANPHRVTASQVGLGNVTNALQATKAEFNTHATSTANPHRVTAAQSGALPIGGGTLTGPLTTSGSGVVYANSGQRTQVFMGLRDGNGNASMDFRTTGNAYLFRNTGGAYQPVYASNTMGACSARYKTGVREMRADEAARLLDVPVHAYRYKPESGFDDGKRHFGVMAERLCEADESYVYYNAEGRVEGANYPALVPALLRLAQAQAAELAALQRRVEALEAAAANGGGEESNGI